MLSDSATPAFAVNARLPWGSGCVEVPAHRVRAMLVENCPWVDRVASALAHLLSVFAQNKLKAEAVAVCRLVVEERPCREQAVKPAARLVDGFRDVVGGVIRALFLLVFKGSMPLGSMSAA